jgi:hypothetical protein
VAEAYRFGGGSLDTTLTPIAALAMVLCIVLLIALPRKHLVIPFLLTAMLVPARQSLVLGGVHLFVVRIIILVGCCRMLGTSLSGGKRNTLGGGFNKVDTVFLCWGMCHGIAFMLLYGQTEAVVNQLGFLWDCLGGYFLLRFAIQDEEDIRRATKVFATITLVCAVCMVFERATRMNVFGLLGGQATPDVREGKSRSQGPFSHAILAGVFGATIIPLFVRLWSTRKDRGFAMGGMVGATVMVITSASSTPLGGYVAGIIGLAMWPLRRNMRVVRWGIVAALGVLSLVMKAPIWFLFAHVDLVGGSSGYHRALLIDQCIRRFGDWWMLGTNNNQNWGWDMWDIQNEFVAEALRGGLAALVFFTLIIVHTFSRLGKARKGVEMDRKQAWLMWTLGAVLLAQIFSFFGSDYFDQSRFWWYASIAISCAATAPLLAKTKEPGAVTPLSDPTFSPERLAELSALSKRS